MKRRKFTQAAFLFFIRNNIFSSMDINVYKISTKIRNLNIVRVKACHLYIEYRQACAYLNLRSFQCVVICQLKFYI